MFGNMGECQKGWINKWPQRVQKLRFLDDFGVFVLGFYLNL